jgi:RNA polymerase sigma-70 factor (sigma-E family)
VEVVVVEPEGFRDFVVRRSPALLRTGRLLTGQDASAHDLVQAALLKTWSRWDGIARGAEEAYVRRVMLSTFLTWRRRSWHGETPVALLPDSATATDPFADADLRSAVGQALGQLTRRQRAVVVLRYFDDLSEADAARALNCSLGTIKSQTSKALANLRKSSLRDLFQEEPSDDRT